MKRETTSKLFPEGSEGMFERFQSLKSNDPYKVKREKYYSNYNRNNWIRDGKNAKKGRDPNFGQFKSKIDGAINTFMGVLTDRKMFVRIIPRYCKPSERKMLSDKISTAFHNNYIRPWEDRFMIDSFCVNDMVFFGKGIEHWPNQGCILTRNVPVENVFPDTNAGMSPKSWSYCFVVEEYTIAELIKLKDEAEKREETEEEDDDSNFSFEYLDEIIKNPQTYASQVTGTEAKKEKKGEYNSSSQDPLIPIVYAYIKDNEDDEKPVSLYCFPAERREEKNSSTGNPTPDKSLKMLSYHKGYAKCISQVLHTRMYQLVRNYWKFNSFAQQIYLVTMLYDKSMSMILRAAKRSMILYWKSSDRKTKEKLLSQTDDEIQVVDDDATYITVQQQTQITEMMQTLRQVMIDTENGLSLGQSPGSQNVKGYAITAEEASIRNQKEGEAEAFNLKIMLANDINLYKEMFRRVMENDDEEFKKSHKAFIEELEEGNVDPKYYEFENVYFSPAYLTGGSQGTRLQNAQGVYATLLQQPSTAGQAEAQRDVIGAFVGYENVDSYIPSKIDVDPVIAKVGSENEDLDSPTVNPKNIPVLPTDKHMQEIPIHVADYEFKLNVANGILQQAQQSQIPFMKMTLLYSASELIAAQDTKGAHITAHIQAVSNSKENMQSLAPLLQKFAELQKMQDQLTETSTAALQEVVKSMEGSSMDTQKLQHTKAMNDLEIEKARNLNDIATAKEIDKKQASLDKSQFNAQVDVQKKGTDLAFKEQQAALKIEEQKTKNELKAKNTKVSDSVT